MTSPQLTAPKLTLNLDTGSLSFSCNPSVAQELQAAIEGLIERFRSNGDESPKRAKPSMEFRHTEGVFLEVFCNPNIWSNAFAAKLYITLKTEHVRVSTEIPLSQVRQDLEAFLAQQT